MDREEIKKTLCPIPWNHSAIMQNGEYGICCQCIYNAAGRLVTENKPHNIVDTDIDDIRNHPTYVELRRSMLAGEKHPMCKLCWDEEEVGRHSKRVSQSKIYADTINRIIDYEDKSGLIDVNHFPVNYLDLRLGNLCNLACRMCGPGDSSLWLDYWPSGQFFIGGRPGIYKINKVGASNKIEGNDFQYYKTNEFESFLFKTLPTVNRIYFTGGEPLINKKHYEILDYCIEKDYAKNITLEYNTNATTLNKNLLEQWNHFKEINICFSMDAMGPLANYIRYPSDWEVVKNNLLLLDNYDIPQILGTTNCTVSILNMMHLPEFYTWFYNQNFKKFRRHLGWNRAVFPRFLNVRILPPETKQMITNYYNKIINESDIPNIREHIYPIVDYMNQEDQQEFLYESASYIHRQDNLRGQNLRDHLPWLADVYNSRFKK